MSRREVHETMRVRIEREVCTGAGDCARAVPEVFVMGDDGLARVQEGGVPLGDDEGASGFTRWAEVPDSLASAVEQATADCPGACIVIEHSEPEPEPEPEPEREPEPEPEPEPKVVAEDAAPSPRSSIPKRIGFRLRRLFG